MKVLASVYACSPYDGSERAVGWNWLKELNQYHEITALTSHVYKNDIEDYLSKNPSEMHNTRFVYIDVPHTSWHVGYRLERLYYVLWQKQAVKKAKELLRREHFDLVHHITYVTCVLPTYMYKLGIPFLLGPVAGGDQIPAIMNYPMSSKDALFEIVRKLFQVIFTSTYNFKLTVKKASMILVATEDTARLVPDKFKNKVEVFQAIGLSEDMYYPEPKAKPKRNARFLMAGRMLYLKGYELGVQAFIRALEQGTNAELTILGDTEDDPSQEAHKQKIMQLCGDYLNREIKFVSKVGYNKMKDFYDGFDILLNCSLRDSGCFVVMEAMSRGLPVILLDTGGPKVNTTVESSIKIQPESFEKMVSNMAEAIITLANDPEKRKNMGTSGRNFALKTFTMKERTAKMNAFYERILSSKKRDIS